MKSQPTVNALLLAVLMAMSLGGCAAIESASKIATATKNYLLGGTANSIPPKELTNYREELQLEVLWDTQIGIGVGDQLLNLAAAAHNGKILVADMEGQLQALDAKTGDELWEADTEYRFSAGPVVSDKIVALATSDAKVVAFIALSGKQKWTAEVPSEVLARPLITGGIVIIRTADGKILALDEQDGSQRWVFESSVPVLSIRGAGAPIVVGSNVIAGTAGGKLISLQLLDGKHNWKTPIVVPSGGTEMERLADLDVDPVTSYGIIFVASFQNGTSAVLEEDGEILWHNEEVSSFAGLSASPNHLYITDSDSSVWKLDTRNGNSLWQQNALQYRKLTAPAIYDNYVVVADYQGYVHWLAQDDGRQLARIKVTNKGIDAKLVVVGQTVYIYATDGTIVAVQAKLF